MRRVLLSSRRIAASACSIRTSSSKSDAQDWYKRVWALSASHSESPPTNSFATDAPATPHANHDALLAAARVALRAQASNEDSGSTQRLPEELVATLWRVYRSLGHDHAALARKERFYALLSEMGADPDAVAKKFELLAKAVAKAPSNETQVRKAVQALADASTPLFARWLQQSASLPDGVKWLIDMRHDVLSVIDALNNAGADAGSNLERRQCCGLIEQELTRLLREWFARSWLVMEELSWDTTPPAVLEQVVVHEAVHPFRSLMDVKTRVRPAPNRHIFAFFHPAVIREPLVMVQVALTRGISGSVDTILGRPSPHKVDDAGHSPNSGPLDTAIFYSINSAQKGLKGIDLGNALIKTVAAELSRLAPHIRTFSTLSPIPGFAAWLKVQDAHLRQGKDDTTVFGWVEDRAAEAAVFDAMAAALQITNWTPALGTGLSAVAKAQVTAAMLQLMHHHETAWCFQPAKAAALEGPVMRAVVFYLTQQKRRSRILDPVGNFHVGNGASIHRVNFMANCTPRGAAQSFTVMVNYLYGDEETTSRNATAYMLNQTVQVHEQVLRWLK